MYRLAAETGELESLEMDLETWDAAHRADPDEFLSLEPLIAFRQSGEGLTPGMLLQVYPPFCTDYEGERSYAQVPAQESRGYLSSLARQIQKLPPGAQFRMKIV